MKRNKFAFGFLLMTIVLFAANIAIIVTFSAVSMKDNFYNSLNVASLSIAFLSFIASSFFSLSVYLQSKEQNEINKSLPKKDDQYIIANYSLFNIEKEVSFFSVQGEEKNVLLQSEKYLFSQENLGKKDVTRLVFLPTDSMNIPTYKVMVKSLAFFSPANKKLYSVDARSPIDGEYSANILQRGYNCISVDVLENVDIVTGIFSKTNRLELELDIISVFNVKMSTKFSVYLHAKKDVDDNVDKQSILDLETYIIHHSNYCIEEKSICK